MGSCPCFYFASDANQKQSLSRCRCRAAMTKRGLTAAKASWDKVTEWQASNKTTSSVSCVWVIACTPHLQGEAPACAVQKLAQLAIASMRLACVPPPPPPYTMDVAACSGWRHADNPMCSISKFHIICAAHSFEFNQLFTVSPFHLCTFPP